MGVDGNGRNAECHGNDDISGLSSDTRKFHQLSMSQALVKDGIRVNAVAPGPIWTPLIPSTFSGEEVAKFGTDTPMGRPVSRAID